MFYGLEGTWDDRRAKCVILVLTCRHRRGGPPHDPTPVYRRRVGRRANARLLAPTHSWSEFSAVLGHVSANSSISIRPAAWPPMVMSKNTLGFFGFTAWNGLYSSAIGLTRSGVVG